MPKALATLGLCALACTSNPTPPANDAQHTPPRPAEPAPAAEPEPAAEPAPAAVPPTKVEAPAEPAAVPPEPAPSVPPLAVRLPAVDDRKAPAIVFAALPQYGQWSVDIVDFAGMDVEALEKRLLAGMESAQDDGPVALDPRDRTFPAGLAVGDPWTLVTPKGAEHWTAKAFEGAVMGGSGQLHLYVHLGEPPKRAKGPRLAFRGHLDPATKLVVPKGIAPAKLAAGTLERIVKALEPGIAREFEEESDELRAIAAAIAIEESHVKLYPGRFPGGRSHVGFVQTDPAQEDTPLVVSGVILAKPDGSVTLFELAGVWGTVELLGLLDVDGDGVDEVFYEDEYHEGWSLEMIQWEGGEPKRRTVTGDGL
jgi:hypothetical protein